MLRKILTGSFALFALFALAGSALFFTESASAQVVAPDSAEVAPEAFRRGEGRRGQRGLLNQEEKAEVVANVLGISVEELAAAKEAGTSMDELAAANGTTTDAISTALYNASVAKVGELVDSGDLTAEEGAEILAKLELKQIASTIIDKDALKQAAADAIGVSVEDVEAAKEDGTMSDLLEENGVTREEVQAAVEASKNTMIDEALANGDITAEQAEQLREQGGRQGNRDGRGGNGEGRPTRGGNGPAAPDANTDDA